MKIKVTGIYGNEVRTFKVHAVPFVARCGPLVGEVFYLHWDGDRGCWSITERVTGASLGRGATLAEVESDFYEHTAGIDRHKWPEMIDGSLRKIEKLRKMVTHD